MFVTPASCPPASSGRHNGVVGGDSASEEPRPVIIGPQCWWNNDSCVLRICRMSERYRPLVPRRCCCRASRLAGALLQ
jgi:hypothetical protein